MGRKQLFLEANSSMQSEEMVQVLLSSDGQY